MAFPVVTPADAPVAHSTWVPRALTCNCCPAVPSASFPKVSAPDAYSKSPCAYVDCPVPPYSSAITVPCQTPVPIVPRASRDEVTTLYARTVTVKFFAS